MSLFKSLFPTVKKVLIKPEVFFEKDIAQINRWQQPIMYLLFFSIIGAFFMSGQTMEFFKEFTFALMEALQLENFFVGFTPSALGIAGLFILLVIILLLATSLKYWIAHWFIKIWNKKASFKYTYAILTYGGTPGWLAMPFSALFFYFLYKATVMHSSIDWLLTMLSLTIWLGLEGYSIYLRVFALAKKQKISKVQAVISVYVLGLLAYLFIVMIIEFVLLFIVFLTLRVIGIIPM
jgi:hypothetical protein